MSVVKVKEIMDALNQKFVQREGEIEAIFLGLLSKQHVLLIGSAGTAKSGVVVEIAKSITGANYFQWLLTRLTKEEELFGALKLDSLEQGIYERNTANKLPQANTSFLDEIFKCNSAILNALLTILNERLYYNNGKPSEVPLSTVIGASNEYPEDDSLNALFDRFLLRREVEYIKDGNDFAKMLRGNDVVIPTISLTELEDLQCLVELVEISDDVINNLVMIRDDLKREGIQASDRRYKQSLSVLQAKALLNGRTYIALSDMEILSDILWEEVSQKGKVKEIVEKYCLDIVQKDLTEQRTILQDLEVQSAQIDATNDIQKRSDIMLDLIKKCADIEKELNDLSSKHSTVWKLEYTGKVNELLNEIKQFKERVSQKMVIS